MPRLTLCRTSLASPAGWSRRSVVAGVARRLGDGPGRLRARRRGRSRGRAVQPAEARSLHGHRDGVGQIRHGLHLPRRADRAREVSRAAGEALEAVGLRFVHAPDGVRIACEVSGEGSPLVLVHGAGSARWSFDAVRPHLESHFTVIAIDRRGRGDSSDGDEYAPRARVRGRGGGGSGRRGGRAADGPLVRRPGRRGRGAAARPSPARALRAGWAAPCRRRTTIDRWERLIAEGDRDTVLREFFRDIAGYEEEAIEELTRSPIWEARRRIVPTLPRELRAELEHRFDAAGMARLTMPVLLLVGTESPEWAVRSVAAYGEAIPASRTRSLDGPGPQRQHDGPGPARGRARALLHRRPERKSATGSDTTREP